MIQKEETMVINHKVPDENPENGDEDNHNETVVLEDNLEISHNHNVTLTGPIDTKPCVTDFLFLPWIRKRKTLKY